MNDSPLVTTDHWVGSSHGRMAVRRWDPRQLDPDRAVPLVLFHDSLGCIDLWRSFPATLAEATGRPVIAYDRLGFGRSDRRDDALGLDFMRAEALEIFPLLRAQLGIGRFIAFGHSVGGAMAAHCAALNGTACAALITESAQFFVEERTCAGIREAREQFRRPEAFARLQRRHGERSRWVLDAWIDTWLGPEFAGWSLEATLHRVRCPTLVIHGSEDEYGSLRHPEGIAGAVRGPAQLALFAATGHVPHREQEQAVARRVAAFLAATT